MSKLTKSTLLSITAIIFILFSACSNMNKNSDYKLYESETGKELSLEKMADKLLNYDVIFFGEFHDDSLIHSVESQILPLLYNKKKNLTISMEMFERDVQKVLNDFLANKVDEEKFIEDSRAWPNYSTDYKEIVEFAKTNNLDIIASNVPRRYASLIAKQGVESFKSIPENEQKYVAKKLTVLDNEYKKNFIATMKANMKARMPKMENQNGREMPFQMMKGFDNIYSAQCLKDDTMAESIFRYLQQHPGTLIIHYNGNFHSEFHLGTANKLQLLDENLKIAVISPVAIEEDTELTYSQKDKDRGDFLLILHK
ncbi:MAG: ChaN family lipoprotein [Candidatus Marinimicrobia bacterium]|nr:ChaN family lipoprotein [Candidatus Neomarinimicrobiota bacterium]